MPDPALIGAISHAAIGHATFRHVLARRAQLICIKFNAGSSG